MKRIACPLCGFPNPINQDICEICDTSLKEALLNDPDPDLISCPTCNGVGLVHLEIKEHCAQEAEEEWLPCAACGGTGRRALSDLRAAAMKKRSVKAFEVIWDLLEIFGR